jgi:hypothetical protein
MGLSEIAGHADNEFLRAVYELAGQTAKRAVAFTAAQALTGHSEMETDRACGFWADRGVLEFPTLNHIALTHVGLRKAQHLEIRT